MLRVPLFAILSAPVILALSCATPAPAQPALQPSTAPTSPLYSGVDPIPPNLADIRARQCHNATDCITVAMSPCGANIAINRHYLYAIQGWNQYMYPRTSCNVAKQNLLLTPVCQSGVCALTNYYAPNMLAAREARAANPLYCESAADCTVGVDACNRKEAVNLDHFAGWQAAHAHETVCGSTLETRPLQGKDCQNNTCVVYLDNSSMTPASQPVMGAEPVPQDNPVASSPPVPEAQ
jgi:hypothetical protein